MKGPTENPVMAYRIARILRRSGQMIRLSLQACVHCALCAESCFMFRASGGNPGYSPSYKAINSIGKIYRKKGKLTESEYDTVCDIAWNRCVLCMRCYCPVGVSIPSLIASARSVCRERGVFPAYDGTQERSMAMRLGSAVRQSQEGDLNDKGHSEAS